MKLSKLINIIENKYPTNIAEKWDNVGLIVGDYNKEINKILICLDISSKAIEKACEIGADLIISHHPMIFSELKKVLFSDITGRKIIRAIEEKIAIYAIHTNLDSAVNGLNEYVWNKLNIASIPIYEEESFNKPIRYYKLNESISIEKLASIIKEKLGIRNIRYVYDSYYTSNVIKKVAIVTGSGMSFLNEVKDKVDVFITADIKHHEALDSLEYGLPLIDFGHYHSEIPSVDLISKFINENTDIETEIYYSEEILKTM